MSVIEIVWSSAHRTSWFPSWWCFQLAAVTTGAIIMARARLFGPFVIGVVAATVLAAAFANGGDWAAWLAGGCRATAPPLELAGFGALTGLVLGFALSLPRASMRRSLALGQLAVAVGPMLAIARVGCFFAGCDFGSPTSMPWALRYPRMTPAFAAQLDAGLVTLRSVTTLPVHPTQLYESALGIVLFLVARRFRSLPVVVLLYAAGRFAIDFLRGDQAHGVFGLTTSQLLAIAAVGLVIGLSHLSAGSFGRRLFLAGDTRSSPKSRG